MSRLYECTYILKYTQHNVHTYTACVSRIQKAYRQKKIQCPSRRLSQFTLESIECFIEVHAFLRSYDFAPIAYTPPLVTLSQFSCVSPVELSDGRGGRVLARSQITKSYDGEKAWPSINHSILSASPHRFEDESEAFMFKAADRAIGESIIQ